MYGGTGTPLVLVGVSEVDVAGLVRGFAICDAGASPVVCTGLLDVVPGTDDDVVGVAEVVGVSEVVDGVLESVVVLGDDGSVCASAAGATARVSRVAASTAPEARPKVFFTLNSRIPPRRTISRIMP